MIRIELTAKQQAALKAALQQVVDGQKIVLTAEGVDLATVMPMESPEFQQDEVTPKEEISTLADFLHEHVGVLHSSEYVPGGARLSEDSGRKFTQRLAAEHQLNQS